MDVYDEILSFIDSKYMRSYLHSKKDTLSVYQCLEIIVHAPRSLEEKIVLLGKLSQSDISDKDRDFVDHYYLLAKKAWECLLNSGNGSSILQLTLKERNTEYGQTGNMIGFSCPAADYQAAVKYMKDFLAEEQEYLNEDTEDEILFNPDWFWELRFYDYPEIEEKYKFICSHLGEVQYFRCADREQDEYDFWDGEINLSVPYSPGDILFIDCRPYSEPTYCVITDIGCNYDCCAVRCLYPVCCGLVKEGAFKHNHCFERHPWHDRRDDYISPLFRAELYEGELPKEYAFLEKISYALKQDSSLGEKIYKYFGEHVRVYDIMFRAEYNSLETLDSGFIDGIEPEELSILGSI